MKRKKVCAIFVLNDRVNADFLFRTEPSTHIDNEYSRAGIQDPKILITTSRDPSSRLLQFAKVSFFFCFARCHVLFSLLAQLPLTALLPRLCASIQKMRLVFPNSHRINCGNYVVKELAEACWANDITDSVVLHEHRGTPGV